MGCCASVKNTEGTDCHSSKKGAFGLRLEYLDKASKLNKTARYVLSLRRPKSQHDGDFLGWVYFILFARMEIWTSCDP